MKDRALLAEFIGQLISLLIGIFLPLATQLFLERRMSRERRSRVWVWPHRALLLLHFQLLTLLPFAWITREIGKPVRALGWGLVLVASNLAVLLLFGEFYGHFVLGEPW